VALWGAARKGGHARGMSGPLSFSRKNMIKLLLLFALCLSSALAQPWSENFGACSLTEICSALERDGCTFSGDYSGAPLQRLGSCRLASGNLDLSNRGITSMNNSFAGMEACR